jgi:hypothetical protein
MEFILDPEYEPRLVKFEYGGTFKETAGIFLKSSPLYENDFDGNPRNTHSRKLGMLRSEMVEVLTNKIKDDLYKAVGFIWDNANLKGEAYRENTRKADYAYRVAKEYETLLEFLPDSELELRLEALKFGYELDTLTFKVRKDWITRKTA